MDYCGLYLFPYISYLQCIPKLVSGMLVLNEAKKNILALGQKQSEKSCRHVSIIVRGGKVKVHRALHCAKLAEFFSLCF